MRSDGCGFLRHGYTESSIFVDKVRIWIVVVHIIDGRFDCIDNLIHLVLDAEKACNAIITVGLLEAILFIF